MNVAVVHVLPGRIRFRTDPDTFQKHSPVSLGRELSGLQGVRSAAVNPRTGSILIFYHQGIITPAQCFEFLVGFELSEIISTQKKNEQRRQHSLGWSYIGYQLFRLFRPPFLRPVFLMAGALPYFLAGLKSLVNLRMDVALLDASAIGASLLQKNTNSASTLLMLLKTGQYLEAWAKQRSRENLSAEISLNPGNIWVRRDGGEIEVPYTDIIPGDHVILRAGTVIPVDGKVLEGIAIVNEAALTGEPLGREKREGSMIYAGTLIEEGEIVAGVIKKGADTRYEQIVSLIMEGENSKAETEIKAYEIADKAVPFSFAAAFLTLILTGNAGRAASVLAIDYSCAIKMSTPLAFLAAIREGLTKGVFFKGSGPLEALANVDTVVFDKTGTLTKATPMVEKIIPYHGRSEREVLKVSACLEEHFPHPVARAVVAEAVSLNVQHREEHTTVKYIVAHGIATEYQGKHTVIGSRHFIGDDEGVDLSAAEADELYAADQGFSVLYLAQEKKLMGILLIKDPLREEAVEILAMLRALGIKRMYLFSGDNNRAVDRIVTQLSLDGGRGELMPEDKARLVHKLKAKGCKVAFIGDGMNDSPAMSAADVSISMKDGCDMAREVAAITLKDSSLYPLVIARIMSARVIKRIRNNIHAAIVLNSIFILLDLVDANNSKTKTNVGNSAGSQSIWLHNMTTIALGLNAMRPLIKD
jgi:Cu2+-exporting ATPase